MNTAFRDVCPALSKATTAPFGSDERGRTVARSSRSEGLASEETMASVDSIRSLRGTLGKTVVSCVFAGAVLGATSIPVDSQELSRGEQQRRHRNQLTFTQFDVPGATSTAAYDINDRGQIVGLLVDAAGVFHGFLLDKGVFTRIDVPGASLTTALGINDRGQIVGEFQDSAGVSQGYVLTDGLLTRVEPPDATFTQAIEINDRGQIVGVYQDAQGIFHGYLLDQGSFTRIDVPGATATELTSINNHGQIAGNFIDAEGFIHQFFSDKGGFTRIDVPGSAPITDVAARETIRINDRGQIASTIPDGTGGRHGYLVDRGAFTQIDVPGALATEVLGISDRGQLAGFVLDTEIVGHGLVASRDAFSARAIGVGASDENAGVEIAGTFFSPTDLDLSGATLTITSLLDEQAGGGELVRGLPLVLTAAPGSHRHRAQFEDPSRPGLASAAIRDARRGVLAFTITVDAATIDAPRQCSPARLTTSFRLDAVGTPPTIVTTERSWDCSGASNMVLETP
jgi:hypothetical protein